VLLEKGVSLSVEYLDGISIVPETKRQETEQEQKRKMLALKPTKLQEIELEEIQELEKLYSPDPYLFRGKWQTIAWIDHLKLVFHYPTPMAYDPFIFHTQNSPSDGFYVGDLPPILPENYDRLVRRLYQTDRLGKWFSGPKDVAIQPDPMCYVHYKPMVHPDVSKKDEWDLEQGWNTESIDLVLKPATRSQLEHDALIEPYLLVVDLVGLQIIDHPLMIPEIKCCYQLRQLVYAWQERKRTDLVSYYNGKLQSLRQEYEDAKPALKELEQERPVPAKQVRLGIQETKRRMERFEMEAKQIQRLKEIHTNRLLRDTEAQTNRTLEYKIVKLWERIKEIRREQGFQAASFKLSIHVKSNRSEYDIEQELRTELYERQQLLDMENARQKRVYEKRLKEWKQEWDDGMDDQDPILHKKRKDKPVEFVEQVLPKKAPHEILRRLKASYPTSEHPTLSFQIHEQGAIPTAVMDCPPREQHRRKKMEEVKLYLVIVYNGVKVTETNPKQLDHAFTLSFHGLADLKSVDNIDQYHHEQRTAFGIQIKEQPRSIVCKVYEQHPLGDLLLAEVFVPLPDNSTACDQLDRQMNDIEFSGIEIPTFDAVPVRIQGNLKMNVTWGTNQQGKVLGPQKRSDQKPSISDPLSFHGPAGLLNLPKMIEWVSKTTFDPNDPRNDDLMGIKRIMEMVVDGNEEGGTDSVLKWHNTPFFRVGLPEWLHRKTLGIGPTDLTPYLKRFEILYKRFTKQILVTTPIPLYGTEGMMDTVVTPNEARDQTEKEALLKWSSRLEVNDPSIVEQKTDLGFLKRIREMQLIRKAALEKPCHVDQYVFEERIAPAAERHYYILEWLRPARPLNPYRNNRKNVITQHVDQCQIVVQVLQGYHLPVRKVSKNSDKPKLRPYVEVSFQKKKLRTHANEGNAPTWNENLAMDIQAPNEDFKPEALMETELATEVLYLNVFDEVIVDLLQDAKERERSTYIRRDRVWLGSVEIPFSTLWKQSRIDGRFPVQLPPTLLGYETDEQQSNVHIFVTLDPPLQQPAYLELKFQTDEPPTLIKQAERFQSQHASSHVVALTNDMGGKSTFVCRYLRPLNPPPDFNTVDQVVRFVSMIPCLPNRTVFAVQCHLWSTADQILSVGAADPVEHCILLANYLFFLGYDAYVAFGSTVLETNTSFVMFKAKDENAGKKSWRSSLVFGSKADMSENAHVTVCMPITGKMYPMDKRDVPVQTIHYLFNHQNVGLG
jgi:hypothetical protein